MTDWRTELGQRIRQIREASEVTQRELANRCGLSSRDSLARLEAGKGELINLLLLREIGMMAIQQSRDANWLLCLPPGVQRLWSIDEMASGQGGAGVGDLSRPWPGGRAAGGGCRNRGAIAIARGLFHGDARNRRRRRLVAALRADHRQDRGRRGHANCRGQQLPAGLVR
jgi:DNA-binding XRE family transcriptional regulator